MSHFKQLANQTAIYGLSSIVGRLLNYLLVPLYTRLLIPAEYGVVTHFYAFLTFLVVLYAYGMETAYFRFTKQHEDSKKVFHTAQFSLTISSTFFSLLLVLFAPSISSWLGYPNKEIYTYLFASILWFDTLIAIPFAWLRKSNKAIRFASLRLINICVNIGLNLFFLVVLPGWENSSGLTQKIYSTLYLSGHEVLYIFISNAIASFITLIFLFRKIRINVNFIDLRLLKSMFRYAIPLLIAGMAGMINETLDRIILIPLINDPQVASHQLGIYGACYKLSIIMTLFIQTYRYASEPFFLSREKENNREILAQALKYFTIVCSIIFLVVVCYLDFIKYFIGEKFWEGLHIVPILLIANICLGIFINLSMWYKLSSETYYGAYFAIIGACITIVFNILLVPTMGYTGAAWATLICYASMMILSFYHGQRKYYVPYQTKTIIAYLLQAIFIYLFIEFVVIPLSNGGKWVRVISGTAFILLYTILAWRRERPQKKLFL